MLCSEPVIFYNWLMGEPGQASPSLGFYPRTCSVTLWFPSKQHSSYPLWQRGDPKESLSRLLETVRSTWAMECSAQLPLDSENALVSQKRGQDTGKWNYGSLFCHWTDLHQQADDSIKSYIIHAIFWWTWSCEAFSANFSILYLSILALLSLNFDDLLWRQWGSFPSTESRGNVTYVLVLWLLH